MNLPVNGVMAIPVGVLLWRSLVGVAGAMNSMHQTTGMIASMVDPTIIDIGMRIQVTRLEENGTAAGTSSRGTINRGTRMTGTTKEAAGRIIEEEIRTGDHCTTGPGNRRWLVQWQNRQVFCCEMSSL